MMRLAKTLLTITIIIFTFGCSGNQGEGSDSVKNSDEIVEAAPSVNDSSRDNFLEIKLVLDQYGIYPDSINLKDSFIYVKLQTGQDKSNIRLQAIDYSNPKMRLEEETIHEYLLKPVVPGGEIQFTITYEGLNESENFTLLHKVKVN